MKTSYTKKAQPGYVRARQRAGKFSSPYWTLYWRADSVAKDGIVRSREVTLATDIPHLLDCDPPASKSAFERNRAAAFAALQKETDKVAKARSTGAVYVAPTAEKKLLMGRLIDDYIAWYAAGSGDKYAPRGTWEQLDAEFRSTVTYVKREFGHLPAASIKPTLWDAWKTARLAEGYAPTTVNRWHAILNTSLRLASRREVIQFGVPLLDRCSERGRERTGKLTPAEFEHWCACFPAEWQDWVRWLDVLTRRKKETRLMTWAQITTDDDGLPVWRIPKANIKNHPLADQYVPLTRSMLEILDCRRLKRLHDGPCKERVFWVPDRWGQPRPMANELHIRRAANIKAFGEQLGADGEPILDAKGRPVPKRNALYHDVRRAGRTEMRRAKVVPESARAVLGQVSDQDAHYDPHDLADKRESYEALEAWRAAELERERQRQDKELADARTLSERPV